MLQKSAIVVACAVGLTSIAGNAYAGIKQWSDGFEDGGGGWWTNGNAGVDKGIGNSHSGANNGWVNNWTGWNAINTTVSTYPGAQCTVTAWLRSSESLTGGYMT